MADPSLTLDPLRWVSGEIGGNVYQISKTVQLFPEPQMICPSFFNPALPLDTVSCHG